MLPVRILGRALPLNARPCSRLCISPSCLSMSTSLPEQILQEQSFECSSKSPWVMYFFKIRSPSLMLLFQSFELFHPDIDWNSFGVHHFPLKKMHFPTLPLAKRFMYRRASLLAQETGKNL